MLRPCPGKSFGRDLGRNATQIRQRGGFILAADKMQIPSPSPQERTFKHRTRKAAKAVTLPERT